MNVPLEKTEQENLVKWLEIKGYDFWAVRNESDGKSYYKGAIRKRGGVKSGIPDMWIILKRGSLLAIEMKRQKKILKSGKIGASPSVISEEQLEWQEKLNEIENVSCEIAYGIVDAVRIVQEYEKL